MAVSFGFYNSVNHDRKYNSEQISRIFDGVIQDGVYLSIGNQFALNPAANLQVIVKSGRCWFNHTWLYNDSDLYLSLNTADPFLKRIDAIIIEIDATPTVRRSAIKVIQGTPSSGGTKPTLTNTALIHQYAIGYVTVNGGATSISAADIEYTVGKEPCPYVTSVLEKTDITPVWNQWKAQFDQIIAQKVSAFDTMQTQKAAGFDAMQTNKASAFDTMQAGRESAFNTMMEEDDAEFQEWFANLKLQLTEDVVTNLQNQINELGTDKVNVADLATTDEAKAGTNNTKWMTPLRTHEHYLANKATSATDTNANHWTTNSYVSSKISSYGKDKNSPDLYDFFQTDLKHLMPTSFPADTSMYFEMKNALSQTYFYSGNSGGPYYVYKVFATSEYALIILPTVFTTNDSAIAGKLLDILCIMKNGYQRLTTLTIPSSVGGSYSIGDPTTITFIPAKSDPYNTIYSQFWLCIYPTSNQALYLNISMNVYGEINLTKTFRAQSLPRIAECFYYPDKDVFINSALSAYKTLTNGALVTSSWTPWNNVGETDMYTLIGVLNSNFVFGTVKKTLSSTSGAKIFAITFKHMSISSITPVNSFNVTITLNTSSSFSSYLAEIFYVNGKYSNTVDVVIILHQNTNRAVLASPFIIKDVYIDKTGSYTAQAIDTWSNFGSFSHLFHTIGENIYIPFTISDNTLGINETYLFYTSNTVNISDGYKYIHNFDKSSNIQQFMRSLKTNTLTDADSFSITLSDFTYPLRLLYDSKRCVLTNSDKSSPYHVGMFINNGAYIFFIVHINPYKDIKTYFYRVN